MVKTFSFDGFGGSLYILPGQITKYPSAPRRPFLRVYFGQLFYGLSIPPEKVVGALGIVTYPELRGKVTSAVWWLEFAQIYVMFPGKQDINTDTGASFFQVTVYMPKASMYGIFTYISHRFAPNVGKYTVRPMDIEWDSKGLDLRLDGDLSHGKKSQELNKSKLKKAPQGVVLSKCDPKNSYKWIEL